MSDEVWRSEYARYMANRFVNRYEEHARDENAPRWNSLPYGVRKSMAEAFLETATEMEGDLY